MIAAAAAVTVARFADTGTFVTRDSAPDFPDFPQVSRAPVAVGRFSRERASSSNQNGPGRWGSLGNHWFRVLDRDTVLRSILVLHHGMAILVTVGPIESEHSDSARPSPTRDSKSAGPGPWPTRTVTVTLDYHLPRTPAECVQVTVASVPPWRPGPPRAGRDRDGVPAKLD